MIDFRAVLFDFDGTLARTLEDHFHAWQAALAHYGVQIGPEDYYPLEGTSVHELARGFARRVPAAMQDDEELVSQLVTAKEAQYLAHHRFELYPGVEEFVEALRATGVRLGIVTAALHDRLVRSVPAEFLAKFDVIITSDQAPRGKPHPDPFLKGAELLGLRPEDCVVVENAPLGIRAAKAANIYCVGIASTMDRSLLSEADCVVHSFRELRTLGVFRKRLAHASGAALGCIE